MNIGTINLMEVSDRAIECKEIGYVISPNYRRKGYAYEADGDVYFRVKKFPKYGALSKQPIDDQFSKCIEYRKTS